MHAIAHKKRRGNRTTGLPNHGSSQLRSPKLYHTPQHDISRVAADGFVILSGPKLSLTTLKWRECVAEQLLNARACEIALTRIN